jgi:hypothetical protein
MNPHVVTGLLESAAATAAVWRLIQLELTTEAPAFTGYLTLQALFCFVFAVLDWNSALYFWTYIGFIPLECLLSILAVRELFALVFKNYLGIRTVGRWSMYAAVASAAAVSVILTKLLWEAGAQGRSHSHMFYWQVTQRSIVFTLAVVIITILFVLSKYPLRLGRNMWVSSAFFGLLFLSESVRLLIDSLAPRLQNHWVDWSETLFITVCLGGWVVLLRPEKAPAPVRVGFAAPNEEHLLRQLESLNQLMKRAARL